tara:strand:+ start:311 stop:667 length:357 start_codon:yes stop_codon:yes gene_type:complete
MMPNLPKQRSKPWVVARDTNRPGSTAMRSHNEVVDLYQTKQWKSLRKYHIQRNPLCKHCKDQDGVVAGGNVVDHIQPVRQGGSPYDARNLQTLCDRHHNIKSRSERDSITYDKGNMKR